MIIESGFQTRFWFYTVCRFLVRANVRLGVIYKTGSFLLFDNLNPRYSISGGNYRHYLVALCIFHGDLDGVKMWFVARKLSPKSNRCVKLLFVKYTEKLLYSQLFHSENIPNLMQFKNLPIRPLGSSTRVICLLWQYSDHTGRFNVNGSSILLLQLGTNTFWVSFSSFGPYVTKVIIISIYCNS